MSYDPKKWRENERIVREAGHHVSRATECVKDIRTTKIPGQRERTTAHVQDIMGNWRQIDLTPPREW